jgi:hypothetical protein
LVDLMADWLVDLCVDWLLCWLIKAT